MHLECRDQFAGNKREPEQGAAPLTQAAFATVLENELRFRCIPFDLADVLEFAGSVWPIARDDPEPFRWADEFLQAVAETAAR